MKNPYKYKTPDLCETLGVSRQTIVNWENKGVFTAPRNMRGDRVFTKKQFKSIVKAFLPGGRKKWHFKG
jgi:DNA-binding transcriptional MerR regulator